MKIKTVIFVLALFWASLVLYAKQSDIEFDAEHVRDLLKNNKPNEAFEILTSNIHSTDSRTRSKAYGILQLRVFKDYPAYKPKVVEVLSSRLNDLRNSQQIYNFLYNTSPEYYTDTAKQNLLDSFKRKDDSLYKTIHLLGHTNVREMIPKIKEILEKYKIQKKEGNIAYHEALARMGDKGEIDYCIEYFNKKAEQISLQHDKEKRNDVKEGWLAGSAAKPYAYIRQPETITLLYKMLMSKNSDSHEASLPHSRRATEAMIKCLMIDDVLAKDQFGRIAINPENIELLREWMKDHYTPEKIKSLSVLIDGQIVNNYASSNTATHKKQHIAPRAKEVKPEVAKIEKKQVKVISKVAPTKQVVPSVEPEQSSNMKYIYLAILCIGVILAFFVTVLVKRRKN